MSTVSDIANFLQSYAPDYLAEEWDNVGLLVGDYQKPVARMMTCLTVTPKSASEAIDRNVDLIISHHPLPFHALKRITTDTVEGRILLDLISQGIAIFSPHTAFDSAREGINQRLAQGILLQEIKPLIASTQAETELGTGRFGFLSKPQQLKDLAKSIQQFLKIKGLKIVGPIDKNIRQVAVACGSAGELLPSAIQAGCDALVLGETTFHTCLAAEAQGIALILPGHYASERFAVEELAKVLASEFESTEVWASEHESDPLVWLG